MKNGKEEVEDLRDLSEKEIQVRLLEGQLLLLNNSRFRINR